MTDAAVWSAIYLGAYLVGAIPVGLLLGKARGIDLREHGSGNIGATNAMRTLGKPLGTLCFGLDVAKGAGPVLTVGIATGLLGRDDLPAAQSWLWLGVAIAAIGGHIAPIYLRFKGGKGVATGLGAFAAFWPWLTLPTLAALVIWIITVKATRYVSVASIAAAITLPAATLIGQLAGWPDANALAAGGWPFLVVTAALGALVVWRHRSNIARLRAGTEGRVGEKSAA